ncbi:hypothetical protein GCK72_012280 [Caenorhabditis remanei]|uniref:EGF-like domain-containing protein n=1 Tax=Caenorhabditis remanei TaxID=31234 RepID=A0A6A5GKL9_CAERE|nr:hypothetical protein GCK72_012280 [Caenorhabditis remanei]KAF1755830.1 hypothetical protein GCK72_012280 [Caenorhabditis remanei]
MQRMMSAMCPGSCSGRGGCYASPTGPECQCREGFTGQMCEIVIEKTTSAVVSAAEDTSDFWVVLLVSALVFFALLSAVGAICYYVRSQKVDVVGSLDEVIDEAKAAPKRVKRPPDDLSSFLLDLRNWISDPAVQSASANHEKPVERHLYFNGYHSSCVLLLKEPLLLTLVH